jgi:hypothetical protein
MKTVKKLTAKQEKEIKMRKIRSLIECALDRYSESELLEAFNAVAKDEYINIEEYEPDEKSESDMVSDLAIKGYCIFKPDSSYKAEQLKEYAETKIFPYYNEQQAAILF